MYSLIGKRSITLKSGLLSAVLFLSSCGIADHLNYAVVFEGEDYGESFIIRAAHLPIAGLTPQNTVKLALLRAAYVTKEKGYKYLYASGGVLISKYYLIDFIIPDDYKGREIRISFHVTNEFDAEQKNFFEAQTVIDSKEIQALR